ncbi:MAG: ion transporter, partial [Pseudomonadota bacterium]
MTDQSQSEPQGLREKVNALVDRPLFSNFILAVILFNAVILGLETSKTVMASIGPMILLLDRICLAIFLVELVLKLYARGLAFFKQGWN